MGTSRPVSICSIALLSALAVSRPCWAEDAPAEPAPPSSKWTLSYVANPAMLVGLQLAYLDRGMFGLGGYLDAKANITKTSPNYDTVTRFVAEQTFHDAFVTDKTQWGTVIAGVTLHMLGPLYFYGGLGYSWSQYWRQYSDNTGIIGTDAGMYWVHDSSKDTSGLNVNAGALLLFGITERRSLSLILGFDRLPLGINLGVGLSL